MKASEARDLFENADTIHLQNVLENVYNTIRNAALRKKRCVRWRAETAEEYTFVKRDLECEENKFGITSYGLELTITW